jgi:hypothetical protein
MINSPKLYLPYISQGVLKKKIKLLNQKGNLCFRKYVAISFSIPFSERVSAEPKGVCHCEERSDEAISFFLSEIARALQRRALAMTERGRDCHGFP